jgi:hypothetical protein
MPNTAMLSQILTNRPAASVDEVVALLTAIDGALPDADGVKWFNRLYLRVTEAVRAAADSPDTFHDPAFLRRLDVVFANLYFDAAAAGDLEPSSAPPAWRPLFQSRHESGIARLQFALAGMNAHINRDLPDAIVKLYAELGGAPVIGDSRHADFEAVNGLLESVEAVIKIEYSTGVIGAIDVAAGSLDDITAMWSVRKARELAWTNSEVMWQLRQTPALGNRFFSRLDSFTGCAGRGFLVRVSHVRSPDGTPIR